jgi:ribonuclease BN (tRNA processing enzyme)
MKLTILGSGTAIPSPRRGAPGLLLRSAERTLLVDCGPGSLRSAARHGVGPGDIDGVLLTHFHHDHTLDLRLLLFALRSLGYEGRPPLTISAPRGFAALLDEWFGAADGEWLRPTHYELRVNELPEGESEVNGLTVTAISVDHTDASLAYRIREEPSGPVLAVSGDTAYCDGAIEAGRDADVYVLECAVPDAEPFGKHLTPKKAAEVAARANPEKLVLTHFYPSVEEEPIEEVVARRFGGEIRLAADGMEIGIGTC